MSIFSKPKKEKESVLIFDIGSSSVGGAVFESNKGGIPKIVQSIREPITLENKIDPVSFFNATIKSIQSVGSRICMSTDRRPTKIFCVLSSPWYASQTRVIKLEKNFPFIFNSKIADDLIKKEIKLFEEEQMSKFSGIDKKVRLIEFKNIQTILNGYATSSPFEKKASKVEMVVFISISGEKILKEVENIIFRHFHTRDVKFSSFAISSFAVVRDVFPEKENFLLVDVGGEVTEISMIKKDVLSSSVSYPLGRNFMIREIAKKLRVSLSEAGSLFSLYKDGHAAESIEKKLELAIKELRTEWLKKFQESLTNISEDISIPSTIFITADQDFLDFFGEVIKNEQFNQYTLTDSKFNTILLDAYALRDFAVFKENIERDPFLIIESVYINRII